MCYSISINQKGGEQMQDFLMGFETIGQILLRIAGGSAAVLLFAAAILLLLCVAGLLFDWVTSALAKRWDKTGRTPKNNLERIILDNYKRL